MLKSLKVFCLLFTFICSTINAAFFDQEPNLVQALKVNNVRVIVLYNFEGTNNVLDIVTSNCSPYYCLTSKGLADLQKTIPIFAAQNISYIFSAPAFRAQQTTNLLGQAFNLPALNLIVDSRLGIQNFGDFDGINYNIYKENFGSEFQMLEGIPLNGELSDTLYTRTSNFLNSLSVYQNETILIVTHAFNYCHIYKILTGEFAPVPYPGKYFIYDFSSP